jgi:hypothetical protein
VSHSRIIFSLGFMAKCSKLFLKNSRIFIYFIFFNF